MRLRLRVLRPIPEVLPLTFGDCVHNLRSALDILACDLIRHAGGTVTRNSAFPIVQDGTHLPEEVRKRLKGAKDSVLQAVEDCKPFEGAGNQFWVLHQLDIIDKHRLLLTVASAGTGIDIGGMATHQFHESARQAGLAWAEDVQVPQVLIRSPRTDCYNDGDIVAEQPLLDGIDRIKYFFDVAVSEPGLVECRPLVPFAIDLASFVEDTVRRFDMAFGE